MIALALASVAALCGVSGVALYALAAAELRRERATELAWLEYRIVRRAVRPCDRRDDVGR